MFCSRPAYCQHCQLWCQCYYVLHYYIMVVVVANSQWLFECCTFTCGFSSTRNSVSFHSILLNNVICEKQNSYLWIVITSNSNQVNVEWVYLHQISRLLSSFVVPHFLLLLNSSSAPDKVRQGVIFRQQRSTLCRGLSTLTLSINTSEYVVSPLTHNPQAIDNSTKLLPSQYFTNLL